MRSTLPTVRNPILALPAWRRLKALPARTRAALASVLRDLSRDADERAEHLWKKSKGPMAVYWRAVSTWSKHIAHATKEKHG